jgi:DNA-binding NarL/FixJ family response regulator
VGTSGDACDVATRVLIGDLAPIAVLGMAAVLREDGIEVVGAERRPRALLLTAGRLRPDAVVLDAASHELADRVQAAAPEATVILWAGDERVMEVLDPGSPPRRVWAPGPDELCGALSLRQSRA